MAEVSITLCGYATTVSCADGEEAQLHQLVAVAQDRADKAASIVGQDRLRQLIFAAIFLADEVQSLGATPERPGAAGDTAAIEARLAAATARINAIAALFKTALAD